MGSGASAPSSDADVALANVAAKPVKRARQYREPSLVVDDLKPLVVDMVDNLLTISKATMGRGASASAKRSASQLISMFVTRIVSLHERLFTMNHIKPDSVDPCVIAMADHMLCILWKTLQDKYTHTLSQLHISLEVDFFKRIPTHWCGQHELHARMLVVFEHTLMLVGLVNDATSIEELTLLLSETKRSMYAMTRGELNRLNRVLTNNKQTPAGRSDVDFMVLMVGAIEGSLECVRKTDYEAILATGGLDDRRTLQLTLSSQMLLPMASLNRTAPVAIVSPRKVNSVIALSLNKGGVEPTPKPRSQSSSALKRPPSTESVMGTSPPLAPKSGVRGLMLSIGEEVATRTATLPIVAPDGAESKAPLADTLVAAAQS